MEYKGVERRACVRFEVPGATANYTLTKRSFLAKKQGEEFCPVADISRGGLRFLCQKLLKINTEVDIQLSIPGEKIPLKFKGRVRWTSPNPKMKYQYQIGIQFYPYGEKKGQNYPGNLAKMTALEQKYVPTEKTEIEEFDIEG